MPDRMFRVDDRLTVRGTRGYAWADTDGRWGAFTPATGGEAILAEGENWLQQQGTKLQGPYLRDFADWLDDDAKIHPCNLAISYHGYERLEAMCLRALDCRRVDLPLDPTAHENVLARMARDLPDVPPLPQS